LLHRKADAVSNYFQAYPLIEEYNKIPSLYKHQKFESINKKFFEKVKTVGEYINGLNYKSSGLGNYKYELQKYFSTDGINLTPEQQKFQKAMSAISKVYEKNSHMLTYITTPYRPSDDMADIVIDILKKIMIF